MLTFKVYKNGNRLKSLICAEIGCFHLTHLDIFREIRLHENDDFIFINNSTKEDVTFEFLMKVFKMVEPRNGDIKLLNRIIKNGGFLNYIKNMTSNT